MLIRRKNNSIIQWIIVFKLVSVIDLRTLSKFSEYVISTERMPYSSWLLHLTWIIVFYFPRILIWMCRNDITANSKDFGNQDQISALTTDVLFALVTLRKTDMIYNPKLIWEKLLIHADADGSQRTGRKMQCVLCARA